MQISKDGKIATSTRIDPARPRCEVCGSLEDVQEMADAYAPRQLSQDERQQYLGPLR